MADQKKPPILKNIMRKFQGLVLGLVGLIDAKDMDVAQPIQLRLSNISSKTGNAFFVFLGCFWVYVGQPHEHIGWATSMPFASIYPIHPRTNPWNFGKKYWELLVLKNSVFLSHFGFFFKNIFVCFIPMTISQNLLIYRVEWMELNFHDYPGFQWIPCYAY